MLSDFPHNPLSLSAQRTENFERELLFNSSLSLWNGREPGFVSKKEDSKHIHVPLGELNQDLYWNSSLLDLTLLFYSFSMQSNPYESF